MRLPQLLWNGYKVTSEGPLPRSHCKLFLAYRSSIIGLYSTNDASTAVLVREKWGFSLPMLQTSVKVLNCLAMLWPPQVSGMSCLQV